MRRMPLARRWIAGPTVTWRLLRRWAIPPIIRRGVIPVPWRWVAIVWVVPGHVAALKAYESRDAGLLYNIDANASLAWHDAQSPRLRTRCARDVWPSQRR